MNARCLVDQLERLLEITAQGRFLDQGKRDQLICAFEAVCCEQQVSLELVRAPGQRDDEKSAGCQWLASVGFARQAVRLLWNSYAEGSANLFRTQACHGSVSQAKTIPVQILEGHRPTRIDMRLQGKDRRNAQAEASENDTRDLHECWGCCASVSAGFFP